MSGAPAWRVREPWRLRRSWTAPSIEMGDRRSGRKRVQRPRRVAVVAGGCSEVGRLRGVRVGHVRNRSATMRAGASNPLGFGRHTLDFRRRGTGRPRPDFSGLFLSPSAFGGSRGSHPRTPRASFVLLTAPPAADLDADGADRIHGRPGGLSPYCTKARAPCNHEIRTLRIFICHISANVP